MRTRLLMAVVAGCFVGTLMAEVIDPGAGNRLTRGTVTGSEDVEVRSGVVTASPGADFGGTLRVTGGTLEITDLGTPANVLVTRVVWPDAGDADPVDFTVRKNEEFNWFEVSPASGTLRSGGETAFTVSLKTEIMTNRHFYRGTFFVSAPNGLSRPVSISAETDFVPPFHAEKPGETAIYADLAHPAAGSCEQGEAEWAFEVPRSGTYYFFVHGAAGSPVTLKAAVDGEAYADSKQQVHSWPTWTMLTPGKKFGDYLRAYALEAGRHTLRIKVDRQTFAYDGVVLTDSPTSFEPR